MDKANSKIAKWRRDEIKEAVVDIIIRCRVESLPVDVFALMDKLGILYTTFSFAEFHGVWVEGTTDGYTIARNIEGNPKYIIVFNENERSRQRVRWTIAHELGHIILGHINKCCAVGDKEAEANYFARELLSPLSALDELGARSAAAIS